MVLLTLFLMQALTSEVVKTIRDIIAMNPLYRLVVCLGVLSSVFLDLLCPVMADFMIIVK